MALLLSALAATLAVGLPLAVALLEGVAGGSRYWLTLVVAALATLALWTLLLRVWVRPWRLLRDAVAHGADGGGDGSAAGAPPTGAGIAGVLAGVADLRLRQRAADREQRRIETLLDALPHGLLVVDAQGRVRLANRRAESILGDATSSGAVAAPPLRPLVDAAIRAQSAGEADVRGNGSSAPSGEDPPVVLAEVSPYRWDSGTAALLVLSDVTRLRRLERVCRDFVANVSHELRTPITAVSGFIETLLDNRMYSSDDARHFLEIAQRQTARMDAILGDLLVLTKLEAEEEHRDIHFQTAAVAPVVDEAVQLCQAAAARNGVRLDVRCDVELTCRMSSQLVEQALINLVDNAVKYGERGQTVWVTATDEEQMVRIAVRDTGAGIPAEHRDRIFERFYRIERASAGDQTGTGLGLAIVRHIARVHGGAIEVASTPGAGSTFSLLLPH